MVVVNAVDHPVQPLAEAVVGLEVEQRAVAPVLAEGPEEIAAGRGEQRLDDAEVAHAEKAEDRDRRQEQDGRGRGMGAGQAVERRRRKDRRRGVERVRAREPR